MQFEQHRRAQIAFAVPLALVLITAAHKNALSTTQSLAIGAGYILGFIITPDLDLPHAAPHRLIRRAFPIIGHALSLYLKLYARLINTGKRPFVHRGISHYPIIGTLTRVAWLCLPLAIISPNTLIALAPTIAFVAIGLAIADLVHIATDGFGLR